MKLTTPNKLRLFALRDLKTGRLIPEYFSDKPTAKSRRDALGAQLYCVTYGPDNRHFKSAH